MYILVLIRNDIIEDIACMDTNAYKDIIKVFDLYSLACFPGLASDQKHKSSTLYIIICTSGYTTRYVL